MVGRSVDVVDGVTLPAPRCRPRPACDPRAPSAAVCRCRTSSMSRSPARPRTHRPTSCRYAAPRNCSAGFLPTTSCSVRLAQHLQPASLVLDRHARLVVDLRVAVRLAVTQHREHDTQDLVRCRHDRPAGAAPLRQLLLVRPELHAMRARRRVGDLAQDPPQGRCPCAVSRPCSCRPTRGCPGICRPSSGTANQRPRARSRQRTVAPQPLP